MASELDLDRLSELEAKATPGPWRVSHCEDVTIEAEHDPTIHLTVAAIGDETDDRVIEDATLIAALRNAAPALIAAAREAETLRALLREMEWIGPYELCPSCDCEQIEGHGPGCRLVAAIAPKD